MSNSQAKFPESKNEAKAFTREIIFQSPLKEMQPLTEIEGYLIFKPERRSSMIHYIHVEDYKKDSTDEPYPAKVLNHKGIEDVTAIYRMQPNGALKATGIIAISAEKLSVWESWKAFETGQPTISSAISTFNEINLIRKIKILHLPDTEEILIGAQTIEAIYLVRLNYKTLVGRPIVIPLPAGSKYNLDNMFLLPNEKVGFFYPRSTRHRVMDPPDFVSSVPGALECFSIKMEQKAKSDNRADVFELPLALKMHVSPDGRFLMVTEAVGNLLREYHPKGKDYFSFKPNPRHCRLKLYEIRQDGLMLINYFDSGTTLKSNIQFLPEGSVIYSPSAEYLRYDGGMSRSFMDTQDHKTIDYKTDPKFQIRIANINKLSTDKFDFQELSTQIPKEISEKGLTYVMTTGDVFFSEAGSNKCTLIPDSVLLNVLNQQRQPLNDATVTALSNYLPSAGVMGLVLGYLNEGVLTEQRPTTLILEDKVINPFIQKIDLLIQKNQQKIHVIEIKKMSDSSNELNKLKESNRCLENYKVLVLAKDKTFTECAAEIWKVFPNIEKNFSGAAGKLKFFAGYLTRDPFRDVYELIEDAKNMDKQIIVKSTPK